MKIGDLVKRKGGFYDASTRQNVECVGKVIKNDHRSKMALVYWFITEEECWTPFRILQPVKK